VRLPLFGDAVRAVNPVEARPARRSSQTCRILVVDDNEDSANSLTMLLRLAGNETRTAYNGLDAVSSARDYQPEVIILDIGLPELNGYDAARRIRQLPGGKDLLLIALTGWGQEEDQRKSKEAGFNAHMVKPVNYEQLMNLLAARNSDRHKHH
jgi:CheY-like chemotaxis protein